MGKFGREALVPVREAASTDVALFSAALSDGIDNEVMLSWR